MEQYKTSSDMKAVAAGLDLGIALLKECNLKCEYCHPFGQSKIAYGKMASDNMTTEEVKQVIDSAHLAGFTEFKFTGGEPTVFSGFRAVVEYAMDMDPSNSINIVTNGTTLEKHIDFFIENRKRIRLQVSIDSTDPESIKYGINKILTPKLKSNLMRLSEEEVDTRINMVVMKTNRNQLPSMIEVASELGFSIKLFNLFIQEDYIAINPHGRASGLEPLEYWRENYVDLGDLVPELSRMASESYKYRKDGVYGSSKGYRIGNTEVLLLDSMKGHFYNNDICIKSCNYFCRPSDRGMYNPHISSNMVLHVDDCYNKAVRWDLRGKTPEQRLQSFNDILRIFSNLKFISGKMDGKTLRFVPDSVA
ncbi:Radical SAM domain protein [mine drainage metagenome]|uniref:Radical SAM domain protein n=1 Tax=mine drainage metagenome TaxID=410659 RepID=T0Z5V7_9ZZZZ